MSYCPRATYAVAQPSLRDWRADVPTHPRAAAGAASPVTCAGTGANQIATDNKIDAANAGAGFTTADVATDFATYVPFTTTVNWQGNQIPVAVARICAWTWACSTPPSGPNIHANKNGYLEIANVFAKAIGKLS